MFQASDSARKIETKTNNKGVYFQLGLAPGDYVLSASKGELVSASSPPMRIIPGQTLVNDFTILDKNAAARASAAGSAAAAKEADAKIAAFTTTFEAGVAASNAGRHDEAIAKFNEAFTMSPTCYDCFNNIGFAYVQKKDLRSGRGGVPEGQRSQAERGVLHRTGEHLYDAEEARSGLRGERKGDRAGSGVRSAVGGNADALFNQGVTMWNSGKIDDAKKAVSGGRPGEPESCRSALSARDGTRQRGIRRLDESCRLGIRDISQTRSDGNKRRYRKVDG